jgi:hypothetical protein
MWSYYLHIETLLRVKSGTKITDRYDLATQTWISIDGNWLLKKRYDGDVFLDNISEEEMQELTASTQGGYPSRETM